jgi:DNA-binding response OmpR family regulator
VAVLDGRRLLAQLRGMGSDTPIVFVAAAGRARMEAEWHDAAGYLSKPFDLDELLTVVARFLPRG